ncbi:hypothetical protein Bca4012_017946 [Brassica carinata]|uniref:Uncharacterized protein n=1 Tax=Brassica carinata TaxID=52824 RepID=A0A8X8BBL8_BRACI|nr:hypothetical protein Bca52824_003619 [Brassica carinata]
MDNPPQGINKVCTCIGIDTDKADKRLKKVEKDYLHASQKYTEANRCRAAENFMNFCNQLAEQIQQILDKLPSEKTKEVIDHGVQSSIFNDFAHINRELRYFQRKLPRVHSRKAVYDLLKETRKKKTCRAKDLSNVAPVCNPTSHDSLRKSVDQEIVVLKKLFKELQKDFEEKLHIEQCAINVYECMERKVKHLEVKKEHLSGQMDILRLNISRC